MRPVRTPASGAAAVATGVIALLHLESVLVDGADGYVGVIAAVLGLTALATAARLWRENCFESRLVAVLLAVATGLGAMLGLTFGLPGEAPREVSALALLPVLVAAAVPLLVLLDVRLRETGVTRGSPYAS